MHDGKRRFQVHRPGLAGNEQEAIHLWRNGLSRHGFGASSQADTAAVQKSFPASAAVTAAIEERREALAARQRKQVAAGWFDNQAVARGIHRRRCVIGTVVDARPAFAAILRREQALLFDPEQQLLADGVVSPVGRIV